MVLAILVTSTVQMPPPGPLSSWKKGRGPLGGGTSEVPEIQHFVNKEDIGPLASELKLPSPILPKFSLGIQRDYDQKQDALLEELRKQYKDAPPPNPSTAFDGPKQELEMFLRTTTKKRMVEQASYVSGYITGTKNIGELYRHLKMCDRDILVAEKKAENALVSAQKAEKRVRFLTPNSPDEIRDMTAVEIRDLSLATESARKFKKAQAEQEFILKRKREEKTLLTEYLERIEEKKKNYEARKDKIEETKKRHEAMKVARMNKKKIEAQKGRSGGGNVGVGEDDGKGGPGPEEVVGGTEPEEQTDKKVSKKPKGRRVKKTDKANDQTTQFSMNAGGMGLGSVKGRDAMMSQVGSWIQQQQRQQLSNVQNMGGRVFNNPAMIMAGIKIPKPVVKGRMMPILP
ncbi:MAG: hypothetical protein M1823_003652 [Watsoniomyces obsoletus]|nr:MAG: hypothetical protein M1823_003652 [Watsoniomyces obsoletus]